MKITLNTNQIADMIRKDSPDSWSYNGARALAEYMEEFEEQSGEEIEFDAVEIRCGWSEYESFEEWGSDYFNSHADALYDLGLSIGEDGKAEQTEEEIDESIRSFIQDRGHLIEFDGGIIVSAF